MKVCTQCKARFTGNPSRCPLDGAALADLPDPLIGKSIGGRYRIESKIGSGGMAAVYRASHDLLGRKVAIKFLSPELALDPMQKERFLREARATNRIKHEHIIDISDYGEEENGLVYLVMELLEGEPLANRIARGPIPPREAIDYLTQTARALGRAHELEVIHRDLKPENIYLVQREGRAHVKLLDFGLAHVRNEVRLTALGSVFGTPEYMSPEQARGQPVGPASDLYALGVVLFEMLTTRIPFEGSTAELIVKHLKAVPPTVTSFNPSVPPEIDAVVAKMLSKDPSQRHRDAFHLIDDLTSLLTLLPEPGRRSKVSVDFTTMEASPPPTDPMRDDHPTTMPVSVRSWIERRAVYRRALAMAYPSGQAPDWVMRAVERMDALLERAAAVESEIERIAHTMVERERLADDLRTRIGRALDELARDESALLRQLDELEQRQTRAQQRAAQSAEEFQRAWGEAVTALRGGSLSMEGALAVESAARRATAWRQGVAETSETASQAELRRVAGDDLRFQVAQLKGRLGAMNAEAEHDLKAMRARASDLGAQMAQSQERLAESGSALAQHLGEFPAVRHVVGGHAAPRS